MRELLGAASGHAAAASLAFLPDRPVAASHDGVACRPWGSATLLTAPIDPRRVLDGLVVDAKPGITAMGSPRFFGLVPDQGAARRHRRGRTRRAAPGDRARAGRQRRHRRGRPADDHRRRGAPARARVQVDGAFGLRAHARPHHQGTGRWRRPGGLVGDRRAQVVERPLRLQRWRLSPTATGTAASMPPVACGPVPAGRHLLDARGDPARRALAAHPGPHGRRRLRRSTVGGERSCGRWRGRRRGRVEPATPPDLRRREMRDTP
jgi:hypothetical protein